METIIKEVPYSLLVGEDDEPVEVISPLRFNKETGEEVYDSDLYEVLNKKIRAEYCRRHHLILPEEIIAFRKQTGLSRKQLADILSTSDFHLELLEGGHLPKQEENVILKAIIKHPELIETSLSETKVSPEEKKAANY